MNDEDKGGIFFVGMAPEEVEKFKERVIKRLLRISATKVNIAPLISLPIYSGHRKAWIKHQRNTPTMQGPRRPKLGRWLLMALLALAALKGCR